MILAVLAGLGAAVGVWAAGFPTSFYGDFPVPGWRWVALLGPYNEHLVRDVGAFYLGLTALTVAAWRRPSADLVRATGAAWLTFSAVHFVWHVLHLGVFSTAQAVGNVVALAVPLVLPVLLLIPRRRESDRRGEEALDAVGHRQ